MSKAPQKRPSWSFKIYASRRALFGGFFVVSFFANQSELSHLTRGISEFASRVKWNVDIQPEYTVNKEVLSLDELTGGNLPPPNCTYPYVPIANIVQPDPYADGRKIPRIIHLSWVSDAKRGRCVHYLQALGIEKWKKALPNYSIYFHDDAAVERLIHQDNWPQFPHLSHMMQCAQMRGAMLIDIWRVLVLYRYGGMYVDFDNFPGPKWAEDTIPTDADFFSLSDAWSRPSQWMFAMQAGHPVGFFTMNEIFKRLVELENIAKPKLVFVTGPDCLKHGYGRAFFWKKDVIFGDGVFHGMYNTTARKIGNRHYNDYVTTNINDIFGVDEFGKNMTVREKIKNDTKTNHWLDEIQVLHDKGVPEMNCLDYLYQMERQTRWFPGDNQILS